MVGTPEDLGRLGQRDDVVHDHRRFVAVQIGELERLVVDQHQHGFFRGEQGVGAALGNVGLGGHGHSLRALPCLPLAIALLLT